MQPRPVLASGKAVVEDAEPVDGPTRLADAQEFTTPDS